MCNSSNIPIELSVSSVSEHADISDDNIYGQLLSDPEKKLQEAINLRKKGNPKDAFKICAELSKENPSLKSYNIYLASAYDLLLKNNLNIDDFATIYKSVLEFYKNMNFERNISATLLKCSNYLIERGMSESEIFYEIYQKCPEEERKGNSFIMTQYFKRLISDGKEQQARDIFNNLPQRLKSNRALSSLFNVKSSPKNDSHSDSNPKLNNRSTYVTIISNETSLQMMQDLLCDFSLVLKPIDIACGDLVSELNQKTFRASKTILLIPSPEPLSDESLDTWMFIMGYCIHKFGKGNIVMMCEDSLNITNMIFQVLARFVDGHTYKNELDIIKILGRRGVIFG